MNKTEIKLINGHFNKQDTLVVLTDLINSKIKHHMLRSLTQYERGEDNSQSEARIKELYEDLHRFQDVLDSVNDDDMLNINCDIIIS